MAAIPVPRPDFDGQFVNPRDGTLTQAAKVLLRALYKRTGGTGDKIDAAHTIATAAVPQGTQVVASGGLQNGAGGGALGGNVGVALYRFFDVLANIPTASAREGDWAYATNGRKPGEAANAGTGIPVVLSNGTWISVYAGTAATT